MSESQIYQCKVYKPNGKLKKIVSAKDCQKEYWDKFDNTDYRQSAMRASITLEGSSPLGKRCDPDFTYINKETP